MALQFCLYRLIGSELPNNVFLPLGLGKARFTWEIYFLLSGRQGYLSGPLTWAISLVIFI